MTILAADLGGTWMRAAPVDGEVLGPVLRRRTPTGDARPDAFAALLRAVAGEGCTAAVVGVPGRVDHAAGRVDHAPNLPAAWRDGLSAAALAEALGFPVALANDADLAAAGEARFGAGRGATDLVYLTFSTGVGGGVVIGGRVLRGRRSLAEVGHMVIDLEAARRGEPCTFEQLASGTALDRRARAAGLELDGPGVVAAMRAGDARARAVFAAVAEAAAVGVTNVAYAYSPERVVIGGGLGLVPELHAPIRERLARQGPPGMAIEVVPAALGDAAGLYGAAAWEP